MFIIDQKAKLDSSDNQNDLNYIIKKASFMKYVPLNRHQCTFSELEYRKNTINIRDARWNIFDYGKEYHFYDYNLVASETFTKE